MRRQSLLAHNPINAAPRRRVKLMTAAPHAWRALNLSDRLVIKHRSHSIWSHEACLVAWCVSRFRAAPPHTLRHTHARMNAQHTYTHKRGALCCLENYHCRSVGGCGCDDDDDDDGGDDGANALPFVCVWAWFEHKPLGVA